MLSRIIHEKGIQLPIKNVKSSNSNTNLIVSNELIETTGSNFTGPIMNSPPNEFMRKIQSRMAVLDIVRDNTVRT